MSDAVLDASAVLAVMLAEPGAATVLERLPGALLSAVNAAEVLSKLAERGMPAEAAAEAIAALGIVVVPFDMTQARQVGRLRPVTRAAGLSLGDRACLALAHLRNLPAVTAERAWSAVAVAADAVVVSIR